MTPAQHNLAVAMCQRAAEVWAAGHVEHAERWFGGAVELVGGAEFVDLEDHEAER